MASEGGMIYAHWESVSSSVPCVVRLIRFICKGCEVETAEHRGHLGRIWNWSSHGLGGRYVGPQCRDRSRHCHSSCRRPRRGSSPGNLAPEQGERQSGETEHHHYRGSRSTARNQSVVTQNSGGTAMEYT